MYSYVKIQYVKHLQSKKVILAHQDRLKIQPITCSNVCVWRSTPSSFTISFSTIIFSFHDFVNLQPAGSFCSIRYRCFGDNFKKDMPRFPTLSKAKLLAKNLVYRFSERKKCFQKQSLLRDIIWLVELYKAVKTGCVGNAGMKWNGFSRWIPEISRGNKQKMIYLFTLIWHESKVRWRFYKSCSDGNWTTTINFYVKNIRCSARHRELLKRKLRFSHYCNLLQL